LISAYFCIFSACLKNVILMSKFPEKYSPFEIESLIFTIRDTQVMLDSTLA